MNRRYPTDRRELRSSPHTLRGRPGAAELASPHSHSGSHWILDTRYMYCKEWGLAGPTSLYKEKRGGVNEFAIVRVGVL